MSKVIHLNTEAKCKNEPTYANLLELAYTDPKAADGEINLFMQSQPLMTKRECLLWLMAYLQGICARTHVSSHELTLNELKTRVTKYWDHGSWSYKEGL